MTRINTSTIYLGGIDNTANRRSTSIKATASQANQAADANFAANLSLALKREAGQGPKVAPARTTTSNPGIDMEALRQANKSSEMLQILQMDVPQKAAAISAPAGKLLATQSRLTPGNRINVVVG